MQIIIGSHEVKSPFLKALILVFTLLFVIFLIKIILLVLFPLIGIILGSTLLIAGSVVAFVILIIPILFLIGVIQSEFWKSKN
jgi:hypothetical protein